MERYHLSLCVGWIIGLTLCIGSAQAEIAPEAMKMELTSTATAPPPLDVIKLLTSAFEKVGAPQDMSTAGIVGWVAGFLVMAFVGFLLHKNYVDAKFDKDAVASVCAAYLALKEGGKKATGPALRTYAANVLKGIGGSTARLAARKGPEVVEAIIHKIANKRKREKIVQDKVAIEVAEKAIGIKAAQDHAAANSPSMN